MPDQTPTSADPITVPDSRGTSALEAAKDQPAGKPSVEYGGLSDTALPIDAAKLDAARRQDAKGSAKIAPPGTPTPKPSKPDPDAPPEDDTPPGKDSPLDYRPKSKTNQAHWKAMREENKALRDQLAAAQGKGAPPAPAHSQNGLDPVKLAEERDQLRNELRRVAIERDPTFKQHWDTQKSSIINQAKFAAGGAAEKLANILQMPGSEFRDAQIEQLTADFSDSAKRRINAALTELDRIDLQRNAEIDAKHQAFESEQAQLSQQQALQQQQQRRQYDQVFEGVLKDWQKPDEGMLFYMEQEGDDAHNAGVKESIEMAKQIYSGNMETEDLARAALLAGSAVRVLKSYESLIQERDALKTQLEKIHGVLPDSLGQYPGSQPDSSGKPADLDSPDYASEFDRKLNEARQRDFSKLGKWG
jgi:hypothetical protein